MKQLSDFNIDKCYKGEDVTENHTLPVVAVFHSVMTILTFLILSESVRNYRVKSLHKKSCRNVLYSFYLNFSFGMAVISQTLLERFLQELTVNSDDSIYYK